MLKGKNLLWVALGAGVAYWYWNKMKKEKAAKAALATTPGSATNFTGDLNNLEYQNYYGVKIVPRYGTTFNQSSFAATHQNAPSWATQGATR